MNQSPPLLVHEEERLLPLPQRAAEIESGDVQPKFRPLLAGAVQEVVICCVQFVAVELPDRAAELLGPGLDHHGDGATRPDAIIRPVVAVERLEFGESVDRRQGTETAPATTIVQFASVQQVDVVSIPGSIKADAVSSCKGVHSPKCG